MRSLVKKSSLVTFSICLILFSVFASILFHVFNLEAWKSNIILCILFWINCLVMPKGWFDAIKTHLGYVVIADMLLGFCFIGNYLFCYPLNKMIDSFLIIEYVAFSISCTPLVIHPLMIMEGGGVQSFLVESKEVSNHRLCHLYIYMAIPLIVSLISLVALNPCIVSYDAYYVIAAAKGLIPLEDYWSVPYIFWYRFLLYIFDSVSFLCFIQVVLFSVVLGYFLFYIEKSFHIKFKLLAFAFLLFVILPNNIMMLITLSKDVYYAIFLCFMCLSLIKLLKERRRRDYFFFGLSIFLVWSIRQSGIILSLFVVIVSAVLIKNRKRVLIAGIISLLISASFNFFVTKFTNAEKIPGGLKYVALYQDILGVYYSGGKLSDETVEIVLRGVGKESQLEHEYTPYWANYDYYYKSIAYIRPLQFIECYMDTFFKNPIIMTRTILCRLDMMWDIYPGLNAYESWQWRVENSGGDWTGLVPKRKENIMTKIYNYFGERSKSYPFKVIIWRVAISNIIFLFLLYRLKTRNALVVALPFLGFLISYAVTLGWSHYRYYWADTLLTFQGGIYVLGELVNKNRGE